MRQPQRRTRQQDTILLSGWLFADLLLALSVIFLVNNTAFHAPARPRPTPTPPVVAVTATPTPVPHLELTPYRIKININGSNSGNMVRQQVQHDKNLQGRRVGLVIIYTGAPTDNDIGIAQQTDEQIKASLQSLDTSGFSAASYYDRSDLTPSTDLYVLDQPSSFVMLDIYLFAQ
jgi:hypothetical protein